MELIWDFDGTLFDTYPLMARTMRRVLQQQGIDEPQATIQRLMEVSMGHAVDHYKQKVGLDDAMLDRFLDYIAAAPLEQSPPFAHVEAICARVCRDGGHNHLCTHSSKRVKTMMDAFGMGKYFSIWVTGDDGFARKPAPDSVQHIIDRSGVDKAEFIMLGDRELDIGAAQNAGIRACLFTNGQTGIKTTADYVLHSFADFDRVIGDQGT